MRKQTSILISAAASAAAVMLGLYHYGIAPAQARAQAEDVAETLNLPFYVAKWSAPIDGLKATLSSTDADPEHLTMKTHFFFGDDPITVRAVAVVDLLVAHMTDRETHADKGDPIYSNECVILNGAVSSKIVARRSDAEDALDWGWEEPISEIKGLGEAHCTALLEAGVIHIPTIERHVSTF